MTVFNPNQLPAMPTLSARSPIILTVGTSAYVHPSDLDYLIVELVGGGGGGGGVTAASSQAACANGGAGGGYSKKKIAVEDLLPSETVVVGSGGPGGPAGANTGSAGSTTTFGSHCGANGGLGGAGQAASATVPRVGGSTGGVGGTAYGGDINIDGDPAFPGVILGISEILSSRGGGGVLAGAARNSLGTGADIEGVPGRLYGGGGSGAYVSNSTANKAGGPGADGVVIIWEYVK